MEQTTENGMRNNKIGRCKISQPLKGNEGRMHFSKRATVGIISVILSKCKFCGHHKAIRYESPLSPFCNRLKCSRCKKMQEE